jgi:hypothetical protein
VKLTFAALAVALTACAADSGPYEGEALPGRSLGKTICLTGCSEGVQGFIERNTWFELEEGMYQLVEETDNTAPTPDLNGHTDLGLGVQLVKGSKGNSRTGELATSVVDGGPTPSMHGNLDLEREQCAGVPFSGLCSATCGAASAVSTAPVGGSICAAIACPSQVVIARCSL